MSRNLFALRIWLITILMATFLTSTPAFAQGGTIVRVEPATVSAKVNDRVEVYIKIDNVTNMVGIQLSLKFDPNVLEVIDLTNGGFLAGSPLKNDFDNAKGTIQYVMAQLTQPAASGNGALLIIGFHTKTNGSSVVSLDTTQPDPLLLSDGNGVIIPTNWADGVVSVAGSAVTSTATSTATGFIPTSTITQTPITPGPTTSTPTLTPLTPTITATNTLTPTPTLTHTNPHGARIHIVRPGENLFCIGRAYKVWPFAIAEVNNIWWPYTIYPNQKLKIPTTVWSPMPAGPVCAAQFSTSVTPVPVLTATVTATPGGGGTTTCRDTYYVRRGDTLYRIAIRYGTNYTELARVNQLANPRLIYVGQRLCIP